MVYGAEKDVEAFAGHARFPRFSVKRGRSEKNPLERCAGEPP